MLTTDEWLPVGSVVHLVGDENYVTILGYMQQDGNTGLMYDYFGLNHPSGFLEPGNDVMFDRDSIDGVLYVGYQDFDWERMIDALKVTESEFAQKKAAAAKGAAERAATAAEGGE